MTREHFKKSIERIDSTWKIVHEFGNFGLDLGVRDHDLLSEISHLCDLIFTSHYDEEGMDWIWWWIYETDNGTNKLEAKDADGNSICQTVDEVYDYIEQYKLCKN